MIIEKEYVHKYRLYLTEDEYLYITAILGAQSTLDEQEAVLQNGQLNLDDTTKNRLVTKVQTNFRGMYDRLVTAYHTKEKS